MNAEKLPKKIACYCRVSTENQIENYSIDEQKERLEAFCKARGWAVPEMFVDAGYSGGTLDRPALQNLLEQVRQGRVEIVIVYKLDRLSRSQKDTLYLIEDVFNKNSVSFVSVCENFDTSTPFGKAMIGILSVFAQLEKDQITERFTMGRIGRAKSGLFHGGGNAPTGYDYVEGHLRVNEYQAMQVREVFSRFAQGESIRAIQQGMHRKYGGWTSHTLVYSVLKNSLYIGRIKFKGQEYSGEHEPIIAPEQFYEVQRLLSERSRKQTAANGITQPQKTPFRAGFLLSGMVYCGSCGARYHGNHGYYKCYSRAKCDKKYVVDPDCKNPNMKIEELDRFIRGEISRVTLDLTPASVAAAEPAADRKEVIRSRLSEIKEQAEKLLDLCQLAGLPLETAAGRLRLLEEERSRLEKQLSELPEEFDRSAKWTESLSRFAEYFGASDLTLQRMYTAALINKVIVCPDSRLIIEWRI